MKSKRSKTVNMLIDIVFYTLVIILAIVAVYAL